MDLSGRIARVLIAAGGLACLAATAVTAVPLSDARWVTPSQRLEALSQRPAECLVARADPATAQSIAIGRAAFRAPLLFGGQAARAGLSCESCHRNGRGNPDFLFPGLSGAPGTADVTSSLLSSHRDDGIVNPKPIPDLAIDVPRVSRDPKSEALKTFIHGVIVEEFDGAEPTPRVLDGLVDYVRAIARPCPAAAQAVTLDYHVEQAREAISAAQASWRAGDRATARLMLTSARSTLALIDERFGGRAEPRIAALELAAIQSAIDDGASVAGQRMTLWKAGIRNWSEPLRRDEPKSLYARGALRRSLYFGVRPATAENRSIASPSSNLPR